MTDIADRPASDPILVIGAGGMLGNALLHDLTRRGFAAVGTVRRVVAEGDPWFTGLHVVPDIDVRDFGAVDRVIAAIEPRWIVNAAAVRNVSADDADRQAAMSAVNAELPHRLAAAAQAHGARLVHISTDGVFDGAAAPYDERATPHPIDPYAVSKLAGEPSGPHVLTLRLSLIGRSPTGQGTLVDWVLGLPHGAAISGYTRSVFSGLPVHEVARFLAERAFPEGLSGTLHLAGPPIAKAALIRLVLAHADRDDVVVRDDDSIVVDRTLISLRRGDLGDFRPPDWPTMIDEMFDFYAAFGLAA